MSFIEDQHQIILHGTQAPMPYALQDPTALPPIRHCDHRIHLKTRTEPVVVRPYRYPHLQKDEIERQCQKMLAQGASCPFSKPKEKVYPLSRQQQQERLNSSLTKQQIRFGPPANSNPLGELVLLRQKGLVEHYQKLFQEKLARAGERVLVDQQVSLFTAGLNEYLRLKVELLMLTGLAHAMNMARAMEQRQQLQQRMSGWSSERNTSSTWQGWRYNSSQGASIAAPSRHTPTMTQVADAHPGNSLPSFIKKLTSAEMAERRYTLIRQPPSQWPMARRDTLSHMRGYGGSREDPSYSRVAATTVVFCITGFSGQLAVRRHKLAAYERELIGLAKAVQHWKPYLWGRAFLIRTDHYSLKFLLEQCLTTSPQQHWISKLLGFDFSVEYRAGRLNKDVYDRGHREVSSEVGKYAWLRPQPYRQQSLAGPPRHKLSP
ncbi:uncharacterized protein [Aristolochia californica]|uniref:uncharacterized protein n=1 Tax=Aristolochia californica TaxID=171875 RepID=UPI0035E0C677